MAQAILCAHASVTFHFVQVLIQPQRSHTRGCAIVGDLPSLAEGEGHGFGKICIVMEAEGFFFIYVH